MPTEMRNKRVAVLTTVHDPNDTRIFHREIPSLLNFGYEVIYCCKSQPLTPTNAQIHLLWSSKNKFLRVLLAPLAAFISCLKLKKIDVFHFHDPELIITGLLLKLVGKKVIYDVHENVPKQILFNEWLPSGLLKTLSKVIDKTETVSAKLFDSIITVIETIAKRFPAEKTFIVQNFPKLNELELGLTIPYQNRQKNIIYVGEISEVRGIRELINALELVSDDIRLTLIGRISSEEYKAKLQSMKGWKKVDFLGVKPRSEVAHYLNQSRIGMVCLHPEQHHLESQPNKLYEYMSVGIPVIASNFPNWDMIVVKSKTGLSVNPLSIEEQANAITYLIENSVEAEEFGKNGKKLIENNYSWEVEEIQLKKAYQSILS